MDIAGAGRLNDMATQLLADAEPGRNLGLLAASIKLLRRALAALEPTGGDSPGSGTGTGTDKDTDDTRCTVWNNLGLALRRVYIWDGDADALAEAVHAARMALAVTPLEHSVMGGRLSSLGGTLKLWGEVSGDPAIEWEAVETMRRAVAATSDDHPALSLRLINLASALVAWQRRSGDEGILDEAVAVARRARAAAGAEGPHADLARDALVEVLRVSSARSDDRAAEAAEAFELARRSADDASPEHPEWAGKASSLSLLACGLAKRTGDRAYLTEATRYARAAVEATSARDPDLPSRLSNLTFVLSTAYRWSGEPNYADEAERSGRAALDLLADAGPGQVPALFNLATLMFVVYERTGRAAALDEAVGLGRRAADIVPAGHSHEATCLAGLSAALHARYTETGDIGVLDEAIPIGRRAVAATPEGHPEWAGRLTNLALMLLSSFERRGELSIADEAAAFARQAVEATPVGHPDRPRCFSNAALVLQYRFEQSGELAVADEAIALARQAVAEVAERPERATLLGNLAGALWSRHARTGEAATLDEAIRVTRQAVLATAPGHPDRALYLSNMAAFLQRRFAGAGQIDPLRDAVTMGQLAVEMTPGDHPDLANRMSNLSIALRALGELTSNDDLLARAAEAAGRADDVTPGDHADKAGRMSNLGLAWRARAELAGTAADRGEPGDTAAQSRFRVEAARAFRKAAGMATAPVGIRVQSAAAAGRLAAAAGDWSLAVTDFEMAIELLPRVAPRRMRRIDQEHHLSRFPGVASDAAACALAAGDPYRALSLLEQGRAVLLGRVLGARADLVLLRRSQPVLARRLAELWDALDEERDMDAPGTPRAAAAPVASAVAARRREFDGEWQNLMTAIRRKPGFGNFLDLPDPAGLLAASAEGPIIAVNVSEFRSDALILTVEGLRVVPLPALTPPRLRAEVTRLLGALDGVSNRLETETMLAGCLRWLWDAVVGPVLDDLATVSSLLEGDEPRVWWMPTGLLAFLPLHAAGVDHAGGTRTALDSAGPHALPANALDRVVSSYTPTIRSLRYVRGLGEPIGRRSRALVVAVPDADGISRLPGVVRETRAVSDRLPEHPRTLTGVAATRTVVLGELQGHAWVHFACHGHSDLEYPSASGLILGGRPDGGERMVSVLDIAQLELGDAELAVLSACRTSGSNTALADEAIHITGAFQLAGFRHVVGTLWPVPDRAALRTVTAVYDRIVVDGEYRADCAPAALHAATLAQRARWPANPSMWAAFVHTGR